MTGRSNHGGDIDTASGPSGGVATRLAHRAFLVLNGRTTVPLLRAGLGAWLGTPIGGWILLLRVRGRKTGIVREIPLSYLIADGSAWVMSGFGTQAQWYRNLLADPRVEVVLPGRTMQCHAEDISDTTTRRRIVPPLVRATGVPGYATGCDPYRSPADRVIEATEDVPLIRLHPDREPLVPGPDDPGGLGWVWRQTLLAIVTIWTIRRTLAGIRRFAAKGPPPTR